MEDLFTFKADGVCKTIKAHTLPDAWDAAPAGAKLIKVQAIYEPKIIKPNVLAEGLSLAGPNLHGRSNARTDAEVEHNNYGGGCYG